MTSIPTQPEPFVVGASNLDDSLIVLPRSLAQHLADLQEALRSATWGELRSSVTSEVYLEILGQAGWGELDEYLKSLQVGHPVPGSEQAARAAYAAHANAPIPGDDDLFDAESIGSYADGDFPPSHQLLMTDLLPPEIRDTYGEVYETIYNGTFTRIEATSADEVIAALERLGLRCELDPDLVDRMGRE